MEQLTEPIAAITEILKTNTSKHHSSHLEELPQCLTDETVKWESSTLSSPSKKRVKINDDSQTETSKILCETIGKLI